MVHGDLRRTWAETAVRCRRLASALTKAGFGKGATIAFLASDDASFITGQVIYVDGGRHLKGKMYG